MNQTFEQWVIETHGKSVYQVELETAQQIFSFNPNKTAREAFGAAEQFIQALKAQWKPQTRGVTALRN